MARIGGVDIPRDKQIQFSLPFVYGIGRATAVKICEQTSIAPEALVSDLTEDEVLRIRAIVEGDLRREIRQNLQRLIEINSYRGQRHRRSLPLRGQRTKTNARTRRGSRRIVSGKKKVARK